MHPPNNGSTGRSQGVRTKTVAVEPDDQWAHMWRVHRPGGWVSDMTNLSRANDAAVAFLETWERRHRRAAEPLASPPVRFSGLAVSQGPRP
jgi:hypothetical protein